MPRFWFGGLWGSCAVDRAIAVEVADETHSIAPTEVVGENPVVGEDVDPFDFDAQHPPSREVGPRDVVQLAPCACGFCSTQVQLVPNQPLKLPVLLQLRNKDRKVNVTLMDATDMTIQRGGRKSQFQQTIVTRSGTTYHNLSTAAKALFGLKSANGFKVSFLNTTEGPVALHKLPRRYVYAGHEVPDPGVCTL